MTKKSTADAVAELLKPPTRRKAAERAPAPARAPKRAGRVPGRPTVAKAVFAPSAGRPGAVRPWSVCKRRLVERMAIGRLYGLKELKRLCGQDVRTVLGTLRRGIRDGWIVTRQNADPQRRGVVVQRFRYERIKDPAPFVPVKDRYIARYGEEAWLERERLGRRQREAAWRERNPERWREIHRRAVDRHAARKRGLR